MGVDFARRRTPVLRMPAVVAPLVMQVAQTSPHPGPLDVRSAALVLLDLNTESLDRSSLEHNVSSLVRPLFGGGEGYRNAARGLEAR